MSDATDVSVGSLVPFSACCCCITSCYCKMPSCIGCKQSGVCFCFQSEVSGCKIVDSSKNKDGKCCVCGEGGFYCVKPQTCCSKDRLNFSNHTTIIPLSGSSDRVSLLSLCILFILFISRGLSCLYKYIFYIL